MSQSEATSRAELIRSMTSWRLGPRRSSSSAESRSNVFFVSQIVVGWADCVMGVNSCGNKRKPAGRFQASDGVGVPCGVIDANSSNLLNGKQVER